MSSAHDLRKRSKIRGLQRQLFQVVSSCGCILGVSWGIFEHLGPSLDHPGAILGHLGTILGHLGSSWGCLGATRGRLGGILEHLGAIFGANCFKLFQVVSSCFKLFSSCFKLFSSCFKLQPHLGGIWGHLGAFGGSWEALACFFGLLLKHGSSFTKTSKNQRKSRVFGGF